MKNVCWKIPSHRNTTIFFSTSFSLNEVVNMTTVFLSSLFPPYFFYVCTIIHALTGKCKKRKKCFCSPPIFYTAISHNVLDLTVEFSCSFQVLMWVYMCIRCITMIPHWFHLFFFSFYFLLLFISGTAIVLTWIMSSARRKGGFSSKEQKKKEKMSLSHLRILFGLNLSHVIPFSLFQFFESHSSSFESLTRIHHAISWVYVSNSAFGSSVSSWEK